MKQSLALLMLIVFSGFVSGETDRIHGIFSERSTNREGVYSKNGSIFCGNLAATAAQESEWQVTGGHTDMKPSWSPIGNRIVFFRVIDFSTHVRTWKTAICVINTDGTGFHQLTSGEFADYNPTWTRDGSLDIIFSRYFDNEKKSIIFRIDPDAEAPSEIQISDPKKSEYALSCTKDGRILISSNRSVLKGVYYLLTPGDNIGHYERLRFAFRLWGFMDRASISPNEAKICYEYGGGWKSFNYVGKRIYIADFDIETLTVSNPRPVSPRTPENITLYPRFNADGSGVIYHSNITGTMQLYLYSIPDGKTELISGDESSDYEFYCGRNTPK